MRLEQLHYIITINKYASLSQAAEALYINQPTLSRTLSAVEKELGVTLFTRSHQGVELTAIGRKMLPHFEHILAEMEQVQALAATEKSRDVSGTLTISAGSILCNNILLDLTAAFNQSYPLVALDISEDYALDVVRRVHQSAVDISFISSVNGIQENLLAMLKQYSLTYEYLIQSPMVAVLPAASPLAKLEAVTAEQLAPYTMFLIKKVQPIIASEYRDSSYHYCPDRDSRNKMILKQQGYAIVSRLEMLDDFYVQEGLLVLKPLLGDALMQHDVLHVGMIYPAERIWKCYEEDFLTLVRQYFAKISLD